MHSQGDPECQCDHCVLGPVAGWGVEDWDGVEDHLPDWS
jgi:hypothetical protein